MNNLFLLGIIPSFIMSIHNATLACLRILWTTT